MGIHPLFVIKVHPRPTQHESIKKSQLIQNSKHHTLQVTMVAIQAISLAEHDINDVDCELKLDYKVGVAEDFVINVRFSFRRFSSLPRGEGRAQCSWHS